MYGTKKNVQFLTENLILLVFLWGREWLKTFNQTTLLFYQYQEVIFNWN